MYSFPLYLRLSVDLPRKANRDRKPDIYAYTYTYTYTHTHIHIYTYVYILFQILFPYRLLQDTEYSSLIFKWICGIVTDTMSQSWKFNPGSPLDIIYLWYFQRVGTMFHPASHLLWFSFLSLEPSGHSIYIEILLKYLTLSMRKAIPGEGKRSEEKKEGKKVISFYVWAPFFCNEIFFSGQKNTKFL